MCAGGGEVSEYGKLSLVWERAALAGQRRLSFDHLQMWRIQTHGKRRPQTIARARYPIASVTTANPETSTILGQIRRSEK